MTMFTTAEKNTVEKIDKNYCREIPLGTYKRKIKKPSERFGLVDKGLYYGVALKNGHDLVKIVNY